MSISRGNTGRYLAGGIVKIKQTLLPLLPLLLPPPPPLLLLLCLYGYPFVSVDAAMMEMYFGKKRSFRPILRQLVPASVSARVRFETIACGACCGDAKTRTSNKDGEKERLAIGFLIHRFSLDYGGLSDVGQGGEVRDISPGIKGILPGLRDDSKGMRTSDTRREMEKEKRKRESKVREEDREKKTRNANRESLE